MVFTIQNEVRYKLNIFFLICESNFGEYSRYPWNQDTVFAFVIIAILQYMTAFVFLWLSTAVLQFFAGIYVYVSCFCSDIREKFNQIDKRIKDREVSSKDAEKEFVTLTQFHVEILE